MSVGPSSAEPSARLSRRASRASLGLVLALAALVVATACSGDDVNAGGAGASADNDGGSGSTSGGAGGSGTPGGSGAGAGTGTGNLTPLDVGLEAYPTAATPPSRGGTMTFTGVGAPGWWPRRLDREPDDADCTLKDGTDTWGGHCCMTEHHTESTTLAPFDEEMTLILKMALVHQLAVYQPVDGGEWGLVSSFDDRAAAQNLWFTQSGAGSTEFPGDLRERDCVWYASQQGTYDCSDSDYFCPNDPGVLHLGWTGSKLFVLLVDFDVDDAAVKECGSEEPGHAGPWIALVASELIRDGGRKWNGLCNCYSKTGTVGDGCGEINLFEVVLDNNEWSNREFASTGVRSFQSGHVGGSVCGTGCSRTEFAAEDDVVDACGKTGYDAGPELPMTGSVDGCPVWKRPQGERYFLILLDETERTIQLALVHPGAIPNALESVLPTMPRSLARDAIDSLAALRLPAP